MITAKNRYYCLLWKYLPVPPSISTNISCNQFEDDVFWCLFWCHKFINGVRDTLRLHVLQVLWPRMFRMQNIEISLASISAEMDGSVKTEGYTMMLRKGNHHVLLGGSVPGELFR